MNKLILWDFDGVIVPSFDAWYEVIKKYHPDYSPDDFRLMFNGNVNEDPRGYNFTDEELYADFEPKMNEMNLVTKIEDVVGEITTSYMSAIVSSSLTSQIESFLERHKLQGFKKIYGNDVHYSKYKKIGLAFKDLHSDGAHSLFITDTLGDILEAKRHSMKTIAVTWGFHPQETLEKGKPDVIVESPTQLTKEVERLLK